METPEGIKVVLTLNPNILVKVIKNQESCKLLRVDGDDNEVYMQE